MAPRFLAEDAFNSIQLALGFWRILVRYVPETRTQSD